MTAFGDGTTEGDELGDGSAATETAPELSAKHSAAKERILTTFARSYRGHRLLLGLKFATYTSAATIASPISLVEAVPPRSGVRLLRSVITFSTAALIRRAASVAVVSRCFRPSHASSI